MTQAAPSPVVSVILPTRNRAHLLRRAIASVLAQTFPDIELIVIDDASTDGTAAALASLHDSRLRICRRETNGGAAAARNTGIALARGAFLAFMDDDDYWLVGKLARQLEALERSDAGWCVTGYIRLDNDVVKQFGGTTYDHVDYGEGLGPEAPDWSLIATPGWLLRRDALERAGTFDERIRSWDDWELGLRLSRVTKRTLVDEPLWIQDWRAGSGLVRAERVRANDLRVIMEKHGPMWAGRVAARHWRIVGRTESLYDPAPAGRRELLRSVGLWPWQVKAWAALAVSFLGQRRVQWLTQQVRRLKNA